MRGGGAGRRRRSSDVCRSGGNHSIHSIRLFHAGRHMESIEARFSAESGVKFASVGEFSSAVDQFTEAISIYPYDFRFFLNRSFCHFYLAEYDKSLDDADQAIRLCNDPVSAKPVYRRALALLALNRLEEALEAFENVLRIDNTCPVSQEKRIELRVALLLAAGFTEAEADTLAQGHETLQKLTGKAIREEENPVAQSAGRVVADVPDAVNLNQSSGDSEPVFRPENFRSLTPDSGSSDASDVSVLSQVLASMPDLLDMDPVTNPIGFHALNAGNVSQQASRTALLDLFSQFGEVDSVFRLKQPAGSKSSDGSVVILVQYKDLESPVRAVEALRAVVFRNGITADPMRPLTLRLTTSQSQKEELFMTLEQAEEKCSAAEECFEWRSPIGCLDEDCGRLHSRANHRLDNHSFFYWLRAQTAAASEEQH